MTTPTRKEVVTRCSDSSRQLWPWFFQSSSSTSSGGSVGRRAGRVAAWLSAHATDAVVAAVIVGLWVAAWRTLDAWTRYGAW